jgi:hypothetical protein
MEHRDVIRSALMEAHTEQGLCEGGKHMRRRVEALPEIGCHLRLRASSEVFPQRSTVFQVNAFSRLLTESNPQRFSGSGQETLLH